MRTHALAPDYIGEPTEDELTNEGTNRGSDFEAKILIGAERLVWYKGE